MDRQLMAVDYSTKGDSVVPDKPRLWAATRVAMTRFRKNMDIHLDGKRFLTVVLNVFDAMRRR